jgi:hypothetical protein
MRGIVIFVCLFAWARFAPASSPLQPQTNCQTITVLPIIEVQKGPVRLADVLAFNVCPQLRQAASAVQLGIAPLLGSSRVLDGRIVRQLLERLVPRGSDYEFVIPERIVVKGNRAPLDGQSQRQSVPKLSPSVMVKPGQLATLIWQQGGIRTVLSVVCLDAGGLGQTVRARTRNGARILRAQIVGNGALRANYSE